MSDLLHMLMDAGLIQFGIFPRDGETMPVQFHLEMLASYPDILEAAAEALRQKMPSADRLLCIFEALPLGVALSLKTGIPLVYSQGGEKEAVHDLVGAYDIGHPAVLVVTVTEDGVYRQLLTTARRVGLDVQSIVALINLGTGSELPTISLLNFPEILNQLVEQELLPPGQARVVKDWLKEKSKSM